MRVCVKAWIGEQVAERASTLGHDGKFLPAIEKAFSLTGFTNRIDLRKEDEMALETVKEVFETMPRVFAAARAAGVDTVFQFHITGKEAGNWQIVVKNGSCEISEGIHDNPSVILTMADVDWLSMCNGQLDGMSAFMSGKLKATGNVMLAQQIPTLFPLR